MDTKIQNLAEQEKNRHNSTINLIASENYPSKSVLDILSSSFSYKYAEGYPSKRYYAGCKNVDEIEEIAIDEAKKLFGTEYANVQPHSGSNANLAAYHTLLSTGQKILAPRLDCGGHLTHGSPASITSELWQFEHYGVDETGKFNYDQILDQAKKFKPDLIIAGTSAYPLSLDWKIFKEIADKVGAKLLADIAHLSGLIVGGQHSNPSSYADIITTTTQKTLRGPRGGLILCNDFEIAKKINKTIFPKLQGGPHMHTIASKAQCFIEANSERFKNYISQVIKNSKTLHSELQNLGCVTWTKETETHLTNIDTVKSFGLSGKEAEIMLEKFNVIVNREALPYDIKPPTETSGLRFGTPAMTTRGMKEIDMKEIANIIVNILKGQKISEDLVSNFAQKFPVL